MDKATKYRHLCILALSGFLTSFGAHIVATNLPSYAQQFGVGTFMIGLLIGVYDFAELFAKPFAGFIADRKGMKTTLLAGVAIFIFGSLLYLVINPSWLLLSRFVQGLGAAALSTVSITLVAKYFETGRGQAFGIYNAIKGAGYVIAPTCGGLLAQNFGFWSIFVACAALGAVTLVVSFFLPHDVSRQELEDDDDDMALGTLLSVFKDKLLAPIYAVITINMFLVGILFGFLPVYLHSIGFSTIGSGALISTATLAYLVVQPFAGHLADRFNVKTTVLVALSFAALSIIAISYTTGPLLVCLAILAGLGIGVVWTNSDTLVSNLAKREQLGATMGAAQSFKEFGDMTGPVLIGGITQFYGLQFGFTACGALALIALFFFSRVTPLSTATQNDVPVSKT